MLITYLFAELCLKDSPYSTWNIRGEGKKHPNKGRRARARDARRQRNRRSAHHNHGSGDGNLGSGDGNHGSGEGSHEGGVLVRIIKEEVEIVDGDEDVVILRIIAWDQLDSFLV